MGHAPLAPSASKSWLTCPGSYAATKDLPEESSEAADEGTFAHHIAAQCFATGKPARTFIGTQSEDRRFTCDEAMANGVQEYVNVVLETKLLHDGWLQVEHRVKFTEHIYGTADALVWRSDVLHVFDFKFGQGILVPAFGNTQLAIYGTAAMLTEIAKAKNVKTVWLHIVQPRRADGEGKTHRVWIVSVEALNALAVEILQGESKALLPEAPLVAGDHCTFCRARFTCSALKDFAMTVAAAAFPRLDAPTAPPLPETFSNEELGDLLTKFDVVETWIAAMRENAEARLRAGTPVPGWKLVETRGHRKWIDATEAGIELRGLLGEGAYEKSLISPAEAERRLGKKVAAGILPSMTVRPITKITMVPASDPKPAVGTTAMTELFSEHPLPPA